MWEPVVLFSYCNCYRYHGNIPKHSPLKGLRVHRIPNYCIPSRLLLTAESGILSATTFQKEIWKNARTSEITHRRDILRVIHPWLAAAYKQLSR